MAYKWDKDGKLVGDGLPAGASIDLNAYAKAFEEISKRIDYGGNNIMSAIYPSMKPKLADVATGFKYDSKTNSVLAFVPQTTQNPPKQNTIADYASPFNTELAGPWDKFYNGDITGMMKDQSPQGSWIPVSGIDLDPSTLSGEANEQISFREDGGAPLAVFGNDKGYMRLRQIPQQAARQADNINLRSNTQRKGPVTQSKARI